MNLHKQNEFRTKDESSVVKNSTQRPVVIGGSNFDVICRVNEAGLEPNASTVNAKIRTCFGGVGRSLAEALAR